MSLLSAVSCRFYLTRRTRSYYLLFTNPGESKVTAFPKGFHMIAGNNERDTYTVGDVYSPDPEKSLWKQLGQTTQVDLKQRAVGFNCMHYGKDPEGTLYRHYLPDKEYLDANCPDGVRFELMFPSCWNGRDLDTLDHQSHMAYPDLVMGGYCPPEFPIRTASMLFETIWDTNAFNGRKGEFVASNGDKKGMSSPRARGERRLTRAGFAYHGDFMMGWESEEFLQQAIDTCTDDSGEQAKCPLFSIQDEYQSGQCKMPTPADLANDKLEGPGLRALPGGVQDVGHQPAPPISSVTYSPGIKPTDSQLLPGQVFHPSDIPAPLQNAPPAETPPPVSYQAVSTQLVSATNIVTEVVWEQAIAYVTEEVDVVTTVTVAGAPPKLKARRRAAGHVRRHGHHGHGL